MVSLLGLLIGNGIPKILILGEYPSISINNNILEIKCLFHEINMLRSPYMILIIFIGLGEACLI